LQERTPLPAQLRNTRQKNAIREAFSKADRPLSPEEALLLAQKQVDGVSIATIYRNIAALLEARWLTPVQMPGAATRYEVAGKEHHHHFQCMVCGATHELAGCAIKVKPKLPRGFKYSGHEFFVYGTCAVCSK
jgi:Fur family ferric uptake transcriptional regulator